MKLLLTSFFISSTSFLIMLIVAITSIEFSFSSSSLLKFAAIFSALFLGHFVFILIYELFEKKTK